MATGSKMGLAVLLSGAALVACGGDDRAQAERTVKDFVAATNDRDSDQFCGELVTQDFLEQATGATGDRAEDACRQQFGRLRGLRVRLVSIEGTRIEDERARVTATLEAQGQRQQQTFRLRKEGVRFRMTGSVPN